MRVRGTFKLGTASAAAASFTMPTGFVIDTAKIANVTNVNALGLVWRLPNASTNLAGTGAGPYPIYSDGAATDKVLISSNAATYQLSNQNVDSVFATSEAIAFEFTVPMSGWAG